MTMYLNGEHTECLTAPITTDGGGSLTNLYLRTQLSQSWVPMGWDQWFVSPVVANNKAGYTTPEAIANPNCRTRKTHQPRVEAVVANVDPHHGSSANNV